MSCKFVMGGGASGVVSPTSNLVVEFLMSAALHDLEAVKRFIEEKGIHPDATVGKKPRALCYSVLKPHIPLMTYLLAKGARPNSVDGMGMTPMHYAAMGGDEYCMAFLVSRGARIDMQNAMGETARDICERVPRLANSREYLVSLGAPRGVESLSPPRFH